MRHSVRTIDVSPNVQHSLSLLAHLSPPLASLSQPKLMPSWSGDRSDQCSWLICDLIPVHVQLEPVTGWIQSLMPVIIPVCASGWPLPQLCFEVAVSTEHSSAIIIIGIQSLPLPLMPPDLDYICTYNYAVRICIQYGCVMARGSTSTIAYSTLYKYLHTYMHCSIAGPSPISFNTVMLIVQLLEIVYKLHVQMW
jgi:hypothetical protein